MSAEKTITDYNLDVAAYEKVISDLRAMYEESFDGNEPYLERRLHILNCKYASLVLERDAMLREKNISTALYPKGI